MSTPYTHDILVTISLERYNWVFRCIVKDLESFWHSLVILQLMHQVPASVVWFSSALSRDCWKWVWGWQKPAVGQQLAETFGGKISPTQDDDWN